MKTTHWIIIALVIGAVVYFYNRGKAVEQNEQNQQKGEIYY